MPATYEPIATTTLSSAASTITFSSIPSTYTDLRWVLTGTVTNIVDIIARFNSDTGTNYSWTRLFGDGSTVTSSRSTSSSSIRISLGNPSTTLPFLIAGDVFSYAGSTNKTMLSEFNNDQNGSGTSGRYVGLWRNTGAITSLSLIADGDTFKTGTTATLYGILKA